MDEEGRNNYYPAFHTQGVPPHVILTLVTLTVPRLSAEDSDSTRNPRPSLPPQPLVRQTPQLSKKVIVHSEKKRSDLLVNEHKSSMMLSCFL